MTVRELRTMLFDIDNQHQDSELVLVGDDHDYTYTIAPEGTFADGHGVVYVQLVPTDSDA